METELFSDTPTLSLFLAFFLSIGLAFMIVPSIRAISRRWSLYDFDVRAEVTLSHIPRHGGIALMVAFGVSAAVFVPAGIVPAVRYLLAATLLLLAAGIQDDLLHLSQFMRLLFVVAAGSLITDVAGMPLLYTGLGNLFNYPLADLLATYLLFVGSVLLLIQASKIPGLVSLILLVCSVNLAAFSIGLGMPGMAVAPLAITGASLVLFISSLGNYVFEGRASALVGGFLLAVLLVSCQQHSIPYFSYFSLSSFFIALFGLPLLVLLGVIRIENGKILLSGKEYNYQAFLLVLMAVLILMCLISLLKN